MPRLPSQVVRSLPRRTTWGRCRYPARMGVTDDDRPLEELVIEFPDDPALPQLPSGDDVHTSLEAQDPPDTHSIRERWARLAEIGGGG